MQLTKKKKIQLTSTADHAISSRQTSRVQQTVLTNSMLVRYESMVSALLPVLNSKFDTQEREELMLVFNRYIQQNPKSIWYFDDYSHKVQFCKIFRSAIENSELTVLSINEARTVLDILEKRLSAGEFFALCDWLCMSSKSMEKLHSVKISG